MSQVISKENDFNAIQFDDTRAEPRSLPEMLSSPEAFASSWDSYEYGGSFEAAVAAWNAANSPEARQRVLDDLRDRAINRANLTKIDGEIATIVAGEAPWHRLGTHVDAAMNTEELFQLCPSLNTTYAKVPLGYPVNGQFIELPGQNGIMMTSPKGESKLLEGVSVSDGFSVHQIRQSAQFLEGIMAGMGGATYDSAGITHDGRRVWMSLLLPGVLEPVSGDETKRYLLLTDAFDTSESWSIVFPTVRTVCANTRRLALANGLDGLKLRHSVTLHKRIQAALNAVEQANKAFADYSEFAQVMAKAATSEETFFNAVAEKMANHSYFRDQLLTDAMINDGPDSLLKDGDLNLDKAERDFARRRANRTGLLARFAANASMKTNTASGTVWGAYNAVTQYANHELRYTGKNVKRQETRMNDIMGGRADAIDKIATEVAEAVCA